MKTYKLSKQAEKDLTGIWQYTLETWSREQANKYLEGLLNAFSMIAKAPEKICSLAHLPWESCLA